MSVGLSCACHGVIVGIAKSVSMDSMPREDPFYLCTVLLEVLDLVSGGSTTAEVGFQTCRKSPGKGGRGMIRTWIVPLVEHGEHSFIIF